MNKGIFILGAGIMQIPAIRIAREQGWFVMAADGNREAPGTALCDRFFHIDLKDQDALLSAAVAYRDKGLLDGVFTAGTDFSAVVAWLAERLSLPGIPCEAALNATDKGRMRERFREAGVASPRFVVVRGIKPGDVPFPPPWVVKPVDNMGARGVLRVDSEQALDDALAGALKNSRCGSAIIEEYMNGPELSLDGLIHRDRLIRCGCADRHITMDPYFVEIGHTMPSSLPDDEVDAAWAILEKGARALGIVMGAVKGDIKITESGPMVGEIAARLSGGFMSGWTYPYASGREVTLGALRIALGMDPGLVEPEKALFSAERAFISIPGEVSGISGVREAEERVGVKNVFVLKQPGTRAVFPRNNVEKWGNVISQGRTREEAITAASAGAWGILPRLVPGDGETETFLFGPRSSWPPPAYVLRNAANLSALESMPEILFPGAGEKNSTPSDRRTSFPSGADLSEEPAPRLAVIPLPCPDEDVRDWIGRPLSTALDLVRARCAGISFSADPEYLRIGRPFWNALFSGGVQGGVWVLDTVRMCIESYGDLNALAEGWR